MAPHRISYLLMLILTAVISLFMTSFSSVIVTTIVIGIFFISIIVMLRGDLVYFLALSPLLFFWSSEMLSGLFIEHGAFLAETGYQGTATGGFSRLSFLYIAYFLIGAIIFSVFPVSGGGKGKRSRFSGLSFELPILGFIAFIVTIAFAFGAVRGFPLLSGQDRFAFRAESDSNAFISFLSNRIIMFAILGTIFARGTFRRSAGTVALFLLAVSILFGEKFTSLVQAAIFFLVPFAIHRIIKGKGIHIGAILMIALVTGLATVPLILLNYGWLNNSQEAFRRLAERMAVQGQLWFLADQYFGKIVSFDAASIKSALEALLSVSEQSPFAADYSYGMYYVMQPFLTERELYWIMFAGGGFVFAHMPYWLMVSGYLGAFAVGLLTFLLYLLNIRRLMSAMARVDLISIVIWAKVMIWILAGYTLGNFYYFLGYKTIVIAIIGLAWDAVSSRMNVQARRDHQRVPHPAGVARSNTNLAR